jgi:hypothetical protein
LGTQLGARYSFAACFSAGSSARLFGKTINDTLAIKSAPKPQRCGHSSSALSSAAGSSCGSEANRHYGISAVWNAVQDIAALLLSSGSGSVEYLHGPKG